MRQLLRKVNLKAASGKHKSSKKAKSPTKTD
jgi:hypothetical protein